MRMLSRRTLLMASAVAPLAGCSTLNSFVGNTTVPQWVTALQAVAAEVGQILPQLQQYVSVPAATASEITAAVSGMQQVLSGVSTSWSQAQGESALQQIETYINNIAPLVLPILTAAGVSIPGGAIISLIIASLPAIEAAVGMVLSALSSTSVQVAQVAVPPSSAASARLRATFAPTPFAQLQQVSPIYLQMLEQRAKAKYAARHRRHK